MGRKRDTEQRRRQKSRRQIFVRTVTGTMVWLGTAVLYYMAFSIFFDTPVEYKLRHSTDRLQQEYELLAARYDTLENVMQNIVERDRNVFRTLFESSPYDFETVFDNERYADFELLHSLGTRQLQRELRQKVDAFERHTDRLYASYVELAHRIGSAGEKRNSIPAIQPVLNKQLSLLTASYGMRIHPFYKTLQSHQGVDYTIPERSRVFATADGTVREVSTNSSTSGKSVTIDHGNGYQTYYAHLSEINVKRGQQVRRGDIIALSGNTGLSLSPHLHYEIRLNGMRVDPIHFFFMELTPVEYRRLMRIAQAGMQSFD